MSNKLDYETRDLLEYRPDIQFIEPEVQSEQPPEELYKTHIDPQTPVLVAKGTQKFAENIEKIAESVQEEADKLSKGFCITLDRKRDYTAIMAMRRHYPDDDPFKVCYEQYKQCKEHLREIANGTAGKMLTAVSEETIKKEKAAIGKAFGGGSTNRDLSAIFESIGPRSDMRPSKDLLEPLDIEEFQDLALRQLANMLWKKFIKPVIPLPPGISFLPDEIAPMPKGAITPDQMMGKK
ncbi:MAG: hypothetical protein CMB80_03545 [Flammeovirgaceae bacterium]|nr:hypothetical protein [Flammeovirgaceae bacterium]|tara:strand:+ start:11117 stop:11827 length:711 start_codon:yes stop_codon:yes gene_type:complete